MNAEQQEPVHGAEDAVKRQKKSRRTILVLAGIVTGMFAFGFALVPLYQVFCNITGYNGSSQGRQAVEAYTGEIDTDRLVTVEFDSTINAGLPWDFGPLTKKLQVHPGEVYEVSYMAKNNADDAIIAQAVPGITPWQATRYFNKMECFCFSNQTLAAGEYKEMPLRFVVSPGLPEDISTLTLSYTFMNIDRSAIRSANKVDNTQPLSMNVTSGGSTQ